MRKRTWIAGLIFLIGVPMAMNGFPFFPSLPTQDPAIQYSFFVAGHTYGTPGDETPGLYTPFLQSFPLLTAEPNMTFGFLAGDIVQKSTKENWDAVDRDLSPLPFPTFKVAGNHDYGTEYWHRKQRYGPSWFSFPFYNDLFIVLDGTWDNWSILHRQWDYLNKTLETKGQDADRVFIIVHQLIWTVEDKRFNSVVVNNPTLAPKHNNYATHVGPLLHGLEKPVYMIAGDLGANAEATPCLYYQTGNVTYLGTGMGNGTQDNLLVFNLYQDGSMRIRPVALNGDDPNEMGSITDFTPTP